MCMVSIFLLNEASFYRTDKTRYEWYLLCEGFNLYFTSRPDIGESQCFIRRFAWVCSAISLCKTHDFKWLNWLYENQELMESYSFVVVFESTQIETLEWAFFFNQELSKVFGWTSCFCPIFFQFWTLVAEFLLQMDSDLQIHGSLIQLTLYHISWQLWKSHLVSWHSSWSTMLFFCVVGSTECNSWHSEPLRSGSSNGG